MKRLFISGNYFYFQPPYIAGAIASTEEAELLNKQLESQAVYHAAKVAREEKEPSKVQEKVQAVLDSLVLEDWSFTQSIAMDILLARLT